MSRSAHAVEMRGVWFAHRRGTPVLVDVDLAIERGERLAMIGPNGGGKTTMLRLLLGLLEPDAGTIEVLGGRPAQVLDRLAYVPQHAAIDVSVPASVLDVVLMGRLRQSPWGLRFGRRERLRAAAALDRVGLSPLASRPLRELSGGQCQRVLIARALIAEPELLLLDEPTTAVDADNEATILASLQDLGDVTVILVSHDLELVGRYCNRAVQVQRRVCPRPLPELRPFGWAPMIPTFPQRAARP